MNKIEQLEQQFLAIQAELEKLKNKKEEYKAMLQTPEGLSRYRTHICEEFTDQETAEAYADAFRVMLELRRQAGSATLKDSSNETAWIITRYGSAEEYYYTCDCVLRSLLKILHDKLERL